MIDWHYPRTALAEQFLDTFELGSSSALTLFAPRRMGKTEFVLQDLIPLATERGYLPVYVSFWEYKADPTLCLQRALRQANKELGWVHRVKTGATSVATLSVGVSGVGSLGVGSNKPRSVDESTLEIISSEFDRLFKGRRRVLLCLDEVQHLATDSAFEPLVYFLRTLIDTRRQVLKVVYTGSSRYGLQRLFNRRKAPLFNSASQIDLPELGSDFVRHILAAFHQATQRKISLQDGIAAFRSLNKVPYELRRVIELLMHGGCIDIKSKAQKHVDEGLEIARYQMLWEELKAIDQAVLIRLVESGRGLYQEESRRFIASWLGIPEEVVPVHVVQNAVNRMRGNLIAPLEYGTWDFEDPQFKQWLTEVIER